MGHVSRCNATGNIGSEWIICDLIAEKRARLRGDIRTCTDLRQQRIETATIETMYGMVHGQITLGQRLFDLGRGSR